MKYEYGIAHRSDIVDGDIWETYRINMSEQEADQWISEWVKDGGAHDAFIKIRKPIGDWEEVF